MRFGGSHIRTRLTASFVAVLAVVLLLYSATACFFLLRHLRQQLVRHAIQDVETVEGLLYFTPTGQLLLRDDYHNHPESKRVLERLLEVRSSDGEVLLRNELLGSRSLGGGLLPNEGEGGYSEREFVLQDGLRVQMVSRRHAIDGRDTVIRLAYSEQHVWEHFRADLIALLLPLPVILSIAGFGGYVLASRLLKPIQEIARKAGEITSDRLHERLPVNSSDGELADLARVFNALLYRLEQSFEQLRRFTSDASHELRTPLAAMRSVGEVGLRKPGSPEAYRDVIGSMLEEANRLTQLVDNLLTIARTDGGQVQVNKSTFPAFDLAKECISFFEALAEEKKQLLVVKGDSQVRVHGDWLLLRQAMVNIIHNAIKYTPEGGRIEVRTRREAGNALLEIQDSGPGIPKDQVDKVFERFFRVEQGRSRSGDKDEGGTGLGLSIAEWNVSIHGGKVLVNSQEGSGCTFTIILQAAA